MAGIMRTAHRSFNLRHESIGQSRRRQLTERPGTAGSCDDNDDHVLSRIDPDRDFLNHQADNATAPADCKASPGPTAGTEPAPHIG